MEALTIVIGRASIHFQLILENKEEKDYSSLSVRDVCAGELISKKSS